jgi:hypothetical protein
MANLVFQIYKSSPPSQFGMSVGGGIPVGWTDLNNPNLGVYSLTSDSLYATAILSNINQAAFPAGAIITVSLGQIYPGNAVLTTDFLNSTDYLIFTQQQNAFSVTRSTTLSPVTGNGGQDYSKSKFTLGQIVPENAISSVWGRLEPLITPEQLRTRHLFGIPMVSRAKDPMTGKPMVMTDEILKDVILRAVSLTETEGNFDVFPVKYREKTAFDRNAFDSFGYMETKRRPVSSIDRLSVTPSNGIDVYQVPQEWIEPSGFQRGQINIVPLTIAFTNGGFIPSQSAGGAAFLSILGAKGWIPGYWQIEYTTGFVDGMLPRELNELIGVIAAIETLSLLATTDADATSKSIGIDGMSQSIGGPGPAKYQARIELLMQKKQMLIDKFKGKFALKMFSSNV